MKNKEEKKSKTVELLITCDCGSYETLHIESEITIPYDAEALNGIEPQNELSSEIEECEECKGGQ